MNDSMIVSSVNTKESLGSVRYEYDSPSMSYNEENIPHTSDGSLTLQRRLFSQPSHFTLPDGKKTQSSPIPHPSTHIKSHTLSHPLPFSTTNSRSAAQSASSIPTKNTVHDSASQISGNVSIAPYNDTQAIITKNLAQSFLDVDASLTQIEKTRNAYKNTSAPQGDRYNVSEKENCEIYRKIPLSETFCDVTKSQLPNSLSFSSHRSTQPLAPYSMPPDGYPASKPLPGQKRSTGGYPLDAPPSTSALDRRKIDGHTHSEKSYAQMSGDSYVKREGIAHGSQDSYAPDACPNSHYNTSPLKPSSLITEESTAPSSSSSHVTVPPHPFSQSPSPTPSHHLSTRTVPYQRSSSSLSSTYPYTAVSSDNEQGSICVPSSNIPLPSAPPNHPFSLKNVENPLLHSMNSSSNKPVYDARQGSFSRK